MFSSTRIDHAERWRIRARFEWMLQTIATSLVVLPGALQACPACALGNEHTRVVYMASTAALSLLPLCIVGLGIWFLRRAARRASRPR